MNENKNKKRPKPDNLAIMIFKMAFASGLAWELAKLAGSKHPFLAPLSVILCLQATLYKSIQFSFHRILGTIIGVCLTVIVAAYVPKNGWSLILLILVASWITTMLISNIAIIHQTALSVLFVFALEKSEYYAIDRIRDTIIGVFVAILVHVFVLPPNDLKKAKNSLAEFTKQLAELFGSAAGWLADGCNRTAGEALKTEIEVLQEQLFKAGKDLEKALKSLDYNPFSMKSRILLACYRDQLHHLKRGYSYLETMLKTLNRWFASGKMTSTDQQSWAEQLRVIASFWERHQAKLKRTEQKVRRVTPETVKDLFFSDSIPLLVRLPEGGEKYQFPVTLFTVTEQFLQELH